jgi:hypothetical protein
VPGGTTPAKRTGRLPKFSEALFDRVIDNILDGQPTYEAIEREGLNPRSFYKNLRRRPELTPRLQAAQVERDRVKNVQRIESAEKELHRRAVEGWEEPVFDVKGNLCGYKRRFSDVCLIFFLKSQKPEVYADRPTALVKTEVNINQADHREILQGWRDRLGAGGAKE